MKTISLKKVSAVAVASLGFGLLSVVPANAVVNLTTAAVVTQTAVTTITGTVGTATTATFFNEIVFTIFLSFSQIKDDLLPGW